MLVIVGRNYLGDQGTTSNSSFIKPITHGANPLMVNNNIPTSFMTWSSPDMILNVCGKDAHISVCCPMKSGLLTFICCVWEIIRLRLCLLKFHLINLEACS